MVKHNYKQVVEVEEKAVFRTAFDMHMEEVRRDVEFGEMLNSAETEARKKLAEEREW